LDKTGCFRPGAADGPTGIRWASDNLETYSPALDRDLEEYQIGDRGDLALADLPMPAALARIEEEVDRLLVADSIPFVLGGEHTIALPIARAVLKRYPDAMILHFDAHADLRESYAGATYGHASWAYHVGREFGYDRLVQLGIRSGLREEFRFARERCACFSMDLRLPEAVRAELATYPLYLTLDIDVLDPACAPGTGTPEAGGVAYRELFDCLYGLAGMRVVAMDINEVAPPLDPTGVTSAVAAKLVREMVLMFG